MDPLSSEEKAMLNTNGAWTTVSRPNITTALNGLDALLDAVGCPKDVYATDYGPTTAEASLTNFSTLPGWDSVNERMIISSSTTANDGDNYTLEGYKTDQGRVDFIGAPFDFKGVFTLRDFAIHVNAAKLNGVQQSSGATRPRFILENGIIDGATDRNINLYDGELRKVLIDFNGADCMGIAPGTDSASVVIDRCLFRRAADTSIAAPSAHGDIIQAVDARNVSITRSVLYLPGTGSTYDEGVYGSTNCLRFADNFGLSADMYFLGLLLAGGGYTVGIGPGAGLMRNVAMLACRFAPVGSDYALFGAFYPVESGLNWENIAFFDLFFSDGSPVPLTGPWIPSGYSTGDWGVFSYNRSTASDKFKRTLWQYGQLTGRQILDGAGNLNPAYNLGNLQ